MKIETTQVRFKIDEFSFVACKVDVKEVEIKGCENTWILDDVDSVEAVAMNIVRICKKGSVSSLSGQEVRTVSRLLHTFF